MFLSNRVSILRTGWHTHTKISKSTPLGYYQRIILTCKTPRKVITEEKRIVVSQPAPFLVPWSQQFFSKFFFSKERASCEAATTSREAARRERKPSGYLGLKSHFHASRLVVAASRLALFFAKKNFKKNLCDQGPFLADRSW